MFKDAVVRRDNRQEPVLDQGIAIAGELRVKLFGLNLLPIQVRLLVSSKDVAAQLGLDWWSDEATRASLRGKAGGNRNGKRLKRVAQRRGSNGA